MNTAPSPISVAVLDDHHLVRLGLASVLESTPMIRVAGCHDSSQALFLALAASPVDVVLLDYSLALADLDGLELLSRLSRDHPAVRRLVVSAHADPITMKLALQAGAHGFFVKNQSLHELPDAIRHVMAGGTYLHELNGAAGAVDQRPTDEEWQVLRDCLAGLSVPEIADRRSRSAKMIRQLKQAAFDKLGIRDDAQMHELQRQHAELR